MGSRARRLARNRPVKYSLDLRGLPAPEPFAPIEPGAGIIAMLRGEPARGPSLFSQTLVDENDIVTFERATPEQEAFVRTMLEGVDADIFKAETGLEKGVALPGYDPPRITSITHESGILETMLSLGAEKNRLRHEAREGFAVELAERIQADLAAGKPGTLFNISRPPGAKTLEGQRYSPVPLPTAMARVFGDEPDDWTGEERDAARDIEGR